MRYNFIICLISLHTWAFFWTSYVVSLLCLPMYQYHIALIIEASCYVLMSDKISLPHGFLFSFLFLLLFWVFTYICFSKWYLETTCLAKKKKKKKTYWYFYKDCIKLTREFSKSSHPREGCVFPYVQVNFYAFQKYITVPSNKVCTFLKFISTHLVFFFPIACWVLSNFIIYNSFLCMCGYENYLFLHNNFVTWYFTFYCLS